MGGYIPPNIFGSVGNFLFHSVKIAAVGKSRKGPDACRAQRSYNTSLATISGIYEFNRLHHPRRRPEAHWPGAWNYTRPGHSYTLQEGDDQCSRSSGHGIPWCAKVSWKCCTTFCLPPVVSRGGHGGGGASAPGPGPVVGARDKVDYFLFFW